MPCGSLRPFSMKLAPLLLAAMPDMPSDGVVAVPLAAANAAPAPRPEEIFRDAAMAQMLVGKGTENFKKDFLQHIQNKVSY